MSEKVALVTGSTSGIGAAIAGSRTVVIPNSGHFMMIERPDETLDALKSYV